MDPITVNDQGIETPVAFNIIPVGGAFVVSGTPYLKLSSSQVYDLVNKTISGDPAVPVFARNGVLTLTRPA